MKQTYGNRIRQSAELLTLAKQANSRLEEMLGSSANLVAAEWDRSEDATGRSIVTLRLSDFTGFVTTAFDPQELASPSQISRRLNRLWGDLLQVRSDVQFRQLQEAGDPEGG